MDRELNNVDETDQQHAPDCFCQLCRPTWPESQDKEAEAEGAELAIA